MLLYPLSANKEYPKVRLGNIPDHHLALVFSQIIEQGEQNWLFIASNPQQARAWFEALQFFLPAQMHSRLCFFSDYETLPYDHFSPQQDIISERLKTIHRCLVEKNLIVITSLSTLLHRLPPNENLVRECLMMKVGENVVRDDLTQTLLKYGYQPVSQVFAHGEYALRGAIMDLFPMGCEQPYRIEFDDDLIVSMRYFDVESQRSTDLVTAVDLLPAKEYLFSEQTISRFRQHWREKFSGNPLHSPIYEQVSRATTFGGIEYYLPLFFEEMISFFSYLRPATTVVYPHNSENLIQQFWQEISERYELYRYDVMRPLLPPSELFINHAEFMKMLQDFPLITYQAQPLSNKKNHWNLAMDALPDILIDHQAAAPLYKLQSLLQAHLQEKFLFCSESPGRKQIFTELLHKTGIEVKTVNSWHDFLNTRERYSIIEAPLELGFHFSPFMVITENDIYGVQIVEQRRRRGRQTSTDVFIKSLAELTMNAPVVHFDHGVGRYLGLQNITVDGHETEFLVLEYANQAKLYVPVAQLHLISRYVGSQEHAPLHHLGGQEWQKIKKKAAEKICDVAAQLLDIYAQRQAITKEACHLPDVAFQTFCQSFPFEETEDQLRAIQEVITDMTQNQVMDRLVCGDVGFGKTEVAMRAAFLAAENHKQVAVLTPTTLLASQHHENFNDRFADYPLTIDVLSRFRTSKEQDEIIQKLQDGKIDIIIGTHKLLQKNIKFKNLGLLIIDEEHRFGVQQKEQIKAMRAHVDILTLTATPIPRTLNMSLNGMRDLSLIATPPVGRLAIRTLIIEKNNVLVREAILRELLRGGQVFYLHNDVASIGKSADEIAKLLPEAKVGIAHGQMRERELEKIMSDFYHQRFNVLVCTTIIETGIDIPSANTIIMDRADRLGLAQLHQLRGRVGRSHHQAYAYLIIPSQKLLTKDAKKRLEAFASLQDLGAGFMLATHDLEIRGAGELLGEEQSGQIASIGFNLYMELLEKAVRYLKAGQTLDLEVNQEVRAVLELQIPALIPEDYCPDVQMRLALYKRIANATTPAMLEDLQVELIERFGLLPLSTKNLFKLTELKLKIKESGIKKISQSIKYLRFEFDSKPKINFEKLLQAVQSEPDIFAFEGASILRMKLPEKNDQENYHQKLLENLSEFLTSILSEF